MDLHASRCVALRPGSWHPVAGVGVLWTARDGPARVLLEPGSEVVLDRLQRFDTVDGHRRHLAPLFAHPSRVDAALRAFAGRGILVDAADCLAGGAIEAAPAPLRAPLVAIRSHRRQAPLARLLDGLRAHEARFGVRRRFLVIDDTPEGDAGVAAAVDAARRGGLDVRLFAARARAAWLASLARRVPALDFGGPLRALLDPAIPGATGARSWNTALLFGAGTLLSLLDDDFHLPWRVRAPAAGIDLGGTARHRVGHHIAGIPEAEADFDVIGRAHELCGRGALSAVSAREGDLVGLTATDVGAWRRRRIGAVVTGTYGAYAWDSSVYANLAGASDAADGLWAEPFDAARLDADAVSFAVDRPTPVPYGGFTPVAMDLRDFAPFAATAGKADDVAFLHLLGAVRRAHCALEVPWLVGHAPSEPRPRRLRAEAPLLADANVLFGARVAHLAAGIDGHDAGVRWGALAALAAAACDDAEALASITARWRIAALSQVVDMARGALAQGDRAPPAWREHAHAVLAANQRALAGYDEAIAPLVAGLRTAMAQLAHGDGWAAAWSIAEREAEDWLAACADG